MKLGSVFFRQIGTGQLRIQLRDKSVVAAKWRETRKAEPGIWMQDVPVPEIGPNDVLIKVRKTAICGTDVHIYNWDQWAQKTVPVPMMQITVSGSVTVADRP